MAIARATDPPLEHPELRQAMDGGYRELLTYATALVRKRRSWLKDSSKVDLAENIVQEAVQRAWKSANQFDTSRRPLAWLMGFIARVAAEELRAERRTPAPATDLDTAWDHALEQMVHLDDSAQKEVIDVLWRARSMLPNEQRLILQLHYDENLTGTELATRLGLPSSGAARIAKHRALSALRMIFQQLLDGGQEKMS
jgi:RNA polymerase sigma factor (sigma-70 family)